MAIFSIKTKNNFKGLMIIFVFLIVGIFSVFYYYWKQATSLPDWYREKLTEEKSNIVNNLNQINSGIKKLETEINAEIEKNRQPVPPQKTASTDSAESKNQGKDEGGYQASAIANAQNSNSQQRSHSSIENNQAKTNHPIEIKIDANQFNELVVSSMAKNERARIWLASAKGFNTSINNGTIEAGAVVNLSEISREQLGSSEKVFIEKAIQTFPFLENQDVYIAIEGSPTLENGQIKLNDHTKIKLGTLKMTWSELSNIFGISRETIEKNMNLKLQVGKLQIQQIEFVEDYGIIRGLYQF